MSLPADSMLSLPNNELLSMVPEGSSMLNSRRLKSISLPEEF